MSARENEAASNDEIRVGHRIKHARLTRGLKLRELAVLLACSESFLSKVENDKVRPSLAMLHKLTRALDINIPSLFSEDFPAHDDPVHITRNSNRLEIKTSDMASGAKVAIERLILTSRGSLLEANIHIVAPGGHTDGDYSHEGEELGFILNGSLELQVSDKWYSFQEGDSFSFHSELRHSYKNKGSIETRILWVNTPPTF